MNKLNHLPFVLILMISQLLTIAYASSNDELVKDFEMGKGFELGKDYEITAAETSSEPLLEEFFNYACSACYSMETFIRDLKSKKTDLKIKAIPVELHASWRIYVEAYFIGEHLGVLDKSHAKIFHRIHVEKNHFKNQQDMKDFFLSLGVNEKDYDGVAGSYWLNTKMRQAKQYAFKHKIGGTPILVINKRYKLDNKALGSYQRIEEAIHEFSKIN